MLQNTKLLTARVTKPMKLAIFSNISDLSLDLSSFPRCDSFIVFLFVAIHRLSSFPLVFSTVISFHRLSSFMIIFFMSFNLFIVFLLFLFFFFFRYDFFPLSFFFSDSFFTSFKFG